MPQIDQSEAEELERHFIEAAREDPLGETAAAWCRKMEGKRLDSFREGWLRGYRCGMYYGGFMMLVGCLLGTVLFHLWLKPMLER